MKHDFWNRCEVKVQQCQVLPLWGRGFFAFMNRGLFGCLNIINETRISYVSFHLCMSSLLTIKYISNEYSALIQFSSYVKQYFNFHRFSLDPSWSGLISLFFVFVSHLKSDFLPNSLC
jgi:hypothetical protein